MGDDLLESLIIFPVSFNSFTLILLLIMTSSNRFPLKKIWRDLNQWFQRTPERALEQAYEAALKIQVLEENEQLNGREIQGESGNYGSSVNGYFNTEVRKNLTVINARLAEFNSSRPVVEVTAKIRPPFRKKGLGDFSFLSTPEMEQSVILEKLKFIDSVIGKYQKNSSPSLSLKDNSQAIIPATTPNAFSLISTEKETEIVSKKNPAKKSPDNNSNPSVLPRSLLGTLTRITRDLDPDAEKEVVQNFRESKVQTILSIRFILLLILIPLLTQQLTKIFVVGPVIDYFQAQNYIPIFVNDDLENEALEELDRFEKKLKFQMRIGKIPEISPEEIEEKLQEESRIIAKKYRSQGSSSIKNIFADLFSLISFAVVIFFGKKEIEIVKSFLDNLVYGLSDSAKAFIIILFTDIFVGFHSPHGWEVILEGVSRHLGIPESREFIFLFIATFPVILDTVFKYWIFRYLNRSSPSAVATYRNMNE